MPNTTEYLTTDELAAHLRVHPETVRRWARAGRIPSLKAGEKSGDRRYDLDAVKAALASAPADSTQAAS